MLSRFKRYFLYFIFFILFLPLSLLAEVAGKYYVEKDPYENFNRKVFNFNQGIDKYFIAPLSEIYKYPVPVKFQKGVSNFFYNIRITNYLISDLLSGEIKEAGRDLLRFVLNTVLGFGGLIDVADNMGIKGREKDLGLAFAKLGIPSGSYLVLPFLGPSTSRDALGRVIDIAIDPISIFTFAIQSGFASYATSLSVRTGEMVNFRALYKNDIELLKESTLDYYTAVKSAYYQRRKGLLEEDTFLSEWSKEFQEEDLK